VYSSVVVIDQYVSGPRWTPHEKFEKKYLQIRREALTGKDVRVTFDTLDDWKSTIPPYVLDGYLFMVKNPVEAYNAAREKYHATKTTKMTKLKNGFQFDQGTPDWNIIETINKCFGVYSRVDVDSAKNKYLRAKILLMHLEIAGVPTDRFDYREAKACVDREEAIVNRLGPEISKNIVARGALRNSARVFVTTSDDQMLPIAVDKSSGMMATVSSKFVIARSGKTFAELGLLKAGEKFPSIWVKWHDKMTKANILTKA